MKKLSLGRICLLIASAIAVIGSGVYFLMDGTDKTFTWLGVIFALIGAVSTGLSFTKFRLAPFVTAVSYSVAFGFVLRVTLPSLSDVWNKVNFIGGNALMGCVFTGVYLLCAVLAIIACFAEVEYEKNA